MCIHMYVICVFRKFEQLEKFCRLSTVGSGFSFSCSKLLQLSLIKYLASAEAAEVVVDVFSNAVDSPCLSFPQYQVICPSVFLTSFCVQFVSAYPSASRLVFLPRGYAPALFSRHQCIQYVLVWMWWRVSHLASG